MSITPIHIITYALILITLTYSSDITFPVYTPHNITIAFGSCNKVVGQKESNIFFTIANLNPDIWI